MAGREEEGGASVSSAVSPGPERCLAAAVMQGLGVVCACTALSDPSWLLVQVEEQNYVYGAAYILHLGFNLTEPGAHHLLRQRGLTLLVLLTACCYASVLLGLSAFLLDFLGTRFMGTKRLVGVLLSPILHFITALSSAAAVALCTYLYLLLYRQVHFQPIKSPANTLTVGESYYFAIFACVASIAATALSSSYARKHRRENGTFADASQNEETSPLLQEPEPPDPPGEYG
ncbi:transmembrane protein 127-like [Rhinoderma darwinii]|uniref:transmembrane protein 127-like n=1 Tax=Rhinoderma darwinii TaxID=43563 RepID=UPI003F67A08D